MKVVKTLMVTINNEDEMISAEDCLELEFDDVDECYEYSYPITYILPDDSTVEIASSDDENAWGSIRRFYEENPEAEGEPILQFPIEIIFQVIWFLSLKQILNMHLLLKKIVIGKIKIILLSFIRRIYYDKLLFY